jgi:hypothetical protein
MKKQATVQYTVRGVPREVDRRLRQKAKRRKQSLNQIILGELSAAAGERAVKANFSDLVGKWVPDPEFDEIIASQRQIDEDMWK